MDMPPAPKATTHSHGFTTLAADDHARDLTHAITPCDITALHHKTWDNAVESRPFERQLWIHVSDAQRTEILCSFRRLRPKKLKYNTAQRFAIHGNVHIARVLLHIPADHVIGLFGHNNRGRLVLRWWLVLTTSFAIRHPIEGVRRAASRANDNPIGLRKYMPSFCFGASEKKRAPCGFTRNAGVKNTLEGRGNAAATTRGALEVNMGSWW
jgi:hypothetical protein